MFSADEFLRKYSGTAEDIFDSFSGMDPFSQVGILCSLLHTILLKAAKGGILDRDLIMSMINSVPNYVDADINNRLEKRFRDDLRD